MKTGLWFLPLVIAANLPGQAPPVVDTYQLKGFCPGQSDAAPMTQPCPAGATRVQANNADDIVQALSPQEKDFDLKGQSGTAIVISCKASDCPPKDQIDKLKQEIEAKIDRLTATSYKLLGFCPDDPAPHPLNFACRGGAKPAQATNAEAIVRTLTPDQDFVLKSTSSTEIQILCRNPPCSDDALRAALDRKIEGLTERPRATPYFATLPSFCLSGTLQGGFQTARSDNCPPAKLRAVTGNVDIVLSTINKDSNLSASDAGPGRILVACTDDTKCDPAAVARLISEAARPSPAYIQDVDVPAGAASTIAPDITKTKPLGITADPIGPAKIRLKSDSPVAAADVASALQGYLYGGAPPPLMRMFYQQPTVVVAPVVPPAGGTGNASGTTGNAPANPSGGSPTSSGGGGGNSASGGNTASGQQANTAGSTTVTFSVKSQTSTSTDKSDTKSPAAPARGAGGTVGDGTTKPGASPTSPAAPATTTTTATITPPPPDSSKSPAPAPQPTQIIKDMAAVNDNVVFTDTSNDSLVWQRARLLTLLDLPRPEVLMNVWSYQASSPDGREILRSSETVRDLVNAQNDALEDSIQFGWAYLSREMERHVECTGPCEPTAPKGSQAVSPTTPPAGSTVFEAEPPAGSMGDPLQMFRDFSTEREKAQREKQHADTELAEAMKGISDAEAAKAQDGLKAALDKLSSIRKQRERRLATAQANAKKVDDAVKAERAKEQALDDRNKLREQIEKNLRAAEAGAKNRGPYEEALRQLNTKAESEAVESEASANALKALGDVRRRPKALQSAIDDLNALKHVLAEVERLRKEVDANAANLEDPHKWQLELDQAQGEYDAVLDALRKTVRPQSGIRPFFDEVFYNYITQKFALDDSDFIGSMARQEWGFCPRDQYCLGYTQAFQPVRPNLTSVLLGAIAARDPLKIILTTIGCMEGKYEVYPECFPQRPAMNYLVTRAKEERKAKPTAESKKRTAANKAATSPCSNCEEVTNWQKVMADLRDQNKPEAAGTGNMEAVRTCLRNQRSKLIDSPRYRDSLSCETLDRIALAAQDRCGVPQTLPLSCFTLQAAQSFSSNTDFSTFTLKDLNELAEVRLADIKQESGFRADRVGLLRAAIADFLYNYKMSQEYPKEFPPYDLQHSAQELNAELNPLIVSFNQDVAAFSRHLSDRLESEAPNHKSFLSDGIITIRGIGGDASTVDTQTLSYFPVTQAKALGDILNTFSGQNAGGAGSSTSTASVLAALEKGTLNPTTAIAALAAITPATMQAQIGRQLTFNVKPYTLPGASSAELDVSLTAADSPPPALYPSGGGASQTDPVSHIGRFVVSSRVRVESVKMFELSSFTALVQRPRNKVPLLPPLIELPWVGSFARLPLPGAKEYHRSTAIVSAVLVPTATDLAYGLEFTLDRQVTPRPPEEGPTRDTYRMRTVNSLSQFKDLPIRTFHKAMVACLATKQLMAFPNGYKGGCEHLTFNELPREF